jgi:hypothetical protein
MIGLEYIIQKLGLNKRKIANDIGANHTQLTHWTSGKKPIPCWHLNSLEKYLRIEKSLINAEITEEVREKINTLWEAIRDEIIFEPIYQPKKVKNDIFNKEELFIIEQLILEQIDMQRELNKRVKNKANNKCLDALIEIQYKIDNCKKQE